MRLDAEKKQTRGMGMLEGSFLALLHMETKGYDLVLHSCLSNTDCQLILDHVHDMNV